MSTIRVTTIATQAGVEVYTAKAWVNFNGTGTVAIRASGNVSSITDNGTGDYTVNFTVAMADANFAGMALPGSSSAVNNYACCEKHDSGRTASSFRFQVWNGSALYDLAYVQAAIFR
jgi:hypothetical protein